jgi:hypothetical protein
MNMTGSLQETRSDEALRSELATATFRVAKRHGFQAALIDIELDVWDLRKEKQIGSPASRTGEAIVLLRRASA